MLVVGTEPLPKALSQVLAEDPVPVMFSSADVPWVSQVLTLRVSFACRYGPPLFVLRVSRKRLGVTGTKGSPVLVL